MGVFTYNDEGTSSVPPAKIFKAFILDSDTLFPKLLPQVFKSVEILQGDGGAGSIKQINFVEGNEYKFLKQRIEVQDSENLVHSHTVIEGDALGDTLESIKYELKFEAAADGGTVVKRTTVYQTKGDVAVSEERVKAGNETALKLFKAVEAYVLANPDAY